MKVASKTYGYNTRGRKFAQQEHPSGRKTKRRVEQPVPVFVSPAGLRIYSRELRRTEGIERGHQSGNKQSYQERGTGDPGSDPGHHKNSGTYDGSQTYGNGIFQMQDLF